MLPKKRSHWRSTTTDPQALPLKEVVERVRSGILQVVVNQCLALGISIVRMVMPPNTWDSWVLLPIPTIGLSIYAFRLSADRPVGTAYLLALFALVVDVAIPSADATTRLAPSFTLSWFGILWSAFHAMKIRRVDKYHP